MSGQQMIDPTPEKQAYYDNFLAQKNGYSSNNYQSGYGIGYGANVSNGFNNFNDANAVRTELDRVNTVMGNRTQYGLSNDSYKSYYDRLNSAISPATNAQNAANAAQTNYQNQQSQNNANYQNQYNQYNNQINQAGQNYQNSEAYKNYNSMMNATIDDIAAKYGFDFSRDYAKQQAEAEAQALRDANANASRQNKSQNELNLATIDSNLMNMAEGLDRDYFQQGLAQQQNQVNSGLNAGIASDQNLRLQMARQAEMGSAYRDANLGIMQENQRYTNEDLALIEALGTINQQALAREDALYNERLQQGYDILSNDRNYYMNAADMEWGQSRDLVNQYLQQQNNLTNNYQWQSAFDYNGMRDQVADSQWAQEFFQNQLQQSLANEQYREQFNYQQGRDQVADNQWQQSFDWSKLMDEAGLTGLYNGQRTLDGQQFDWAKLVDQAGLTGLFNGQKTWDRQLAEAELALQRASLAASRSYGGSGSGRSSSSASSSSSSNSLADAYKQYSAAKTGNTVAQSKLGTQGAAAYNAVKTNKVSNKSLTDKYVEALGDGAIAPSTTTSLDKLVNMWNVLKR